MEKSFDYSIIELKEGKIMRILIKDGNVHDGLGKVYEAWDVLIDDGKIIKLGKNIEDKADKIIDASNQEVLPGFIDPLTGWGCAAGRGQARDNDEKSDPLTPHLSAYYAFDPNAMMYQKLWEYGITAAGIAPSNSNLLGGQIAVFKSWGTGLEDMLVKENVAMKGSLTQFKDCYGSKNSMPMTRMGAFYMLENAVKKALSEKEEDLKDEKNIAFRKVLKKEMPLFMSCNTKADMDGVSKVFKDSDAELVLANCYGIDQSYINKNCSIILGDLTDGFNHYNACVDFDAILDMIEADKPVSLSAYGDTTSPGREILHWNAQELLKQANCRGRKLDPEKLLAMMSSIPAKMLKVDERIGALKVGLDADVVIWSAHPLKWANAHPTTVIVSGQLTGGDEE